MKELIPHVVYHVACMGNWRDVITEQFALLKNSGLSDALRSINDSVGISHVGGSLDVVLEMARQYNVPVHVIRSDSNTDHYETFAMIEIDKLAKEEKTNRPIIYMHTKGVSNPSDKSKMLWRRCMEYAVVTKWRENVGYIADGGKYDAVGFIWIGHGEQHFTGTFWIARADWIRKLPPFVQYHHAKRLERYSCELWIGAQAHPTCRVFCYGPVNQFVHYGNFDFTPHLPPPDIKPVTQKSMNRQGVTWCSAATVNYVQDLSHLQSSFKRLDEGHELVTRVLPKAGRVPWRHSMKLDAMRSMIPLIETSHVFWIDADCRFVNNIPLDNLIKSDKSLSVVQHFLYNKPSDGMPERLIGRLPPVIHDIYWQACLWGGEMSVVAEVLNDVRWIANDERGYDEHGLNIEFQKRFDQVHTLPCRFATPETFEGLPEGSLQSYEQRSGGSQLVVHCNREIRQ